MRSPRKEEIAEKSPRGLLCKKQQDPSCCAGGWVGVLCAKGTCVWGFCRDGCLCFLLGLEDSEFLEGSERGKMAWNQHIKSSVWEGAFCRE